MTFAWGAGLAVVERVAFPDAADLWGYGATRLVGVAILAYAIVRHQLLGIDVKVRWTLSKSTLAAAFIATFFVASEGAQLLFGAGNEWVGLFAAGALVFAMAPLQRAAERLTEKAVPTGGSPAAASVCADADARAAVYRAAVRAALRDGRFERREEIYLMEVAEHLGLDPRDAARLRHEAEDAERSATAVVE